jgi:hypothetical protein
MKKLNIKKYIPAVFSLAFILLISFQSHIQAFECNDNADNDADGQIDFPADSGCTNAEDDYEGNLIDSNGWTQLTPTPFDTTTFPLTNLQQPGSRIFYISSSGDNATGVMYFWNGTAIVDSQGSTTGAGGVAYGSDPMNPTGPIRPFRSWPHVAPRAYSNAFRCNGDIGAPWDGTYAGEPGGLKPCTRTGFPDWWLFKRGDTFDLFQEYLAYVRQSNPNASTVSGGGLGVSGGRSESEKQVVGAYGNSALDRPRFINSTGYFIHRWSEPDPKHIAYLSLHFDGRAGNGQGGGIRFLYQTADAIDNLIEDVWFDAAKGLIVQDTDMQITFRRVTVTDASRSDGNHQQGIFFSGNSMSRLRFEECTFMRNGMSHGDPEVTGWPPSTTNGQYWDIYNRNFYLSGESRNMDSGMFNTLSLLGASGDQSRGGMRIENNFFYQGYLSQAGHGGYPDSYGPTGTFKNNVFQRFRGRNTSDNRGQPGWGMQLGSGANGVEVSGNIVTNAQYDGSYAFKLTGTVGWPCATLTFHYPTRNNLIFNNIFDSGSAPAAIDIEDGVDADVLECSEWQYPGLTNNNITNNTIINANRVVSRYAPYASAVGTTHDTVISNNPVYSSRAEAKAALGWPDPDRTLRSYVQFIGDTVTTDDGFLEFFREAKLQRKGNWRPAYTAKALNDYIRAGFGIGSGGPQPLENERPRVSAGADQSLLWPANTITLNGNVTDDGRPVSAQVTIQWIQISGPPGATISAANSAITDVTFPALGTYIFRLIANDTFFSNQDDVRIVVGDSSVINPVNSGDTAFYACHDLKNRGDVPICYSLANQGHVTLILYNKKGEEIRKLWDGDRPAGGDTVMWDKRNSSGDVVASGIYTVTMEVDGKKYKTKVAVIK